MSRFPSACPLLLAVLFAAACSGMPRTGAGVSSVDREVRSFMARWSVPGLSLAVVHDGRLVVARGYGYADPGAREPARPGTLYRIASAAKPVTAVAVMRLVEVGRLRLDARVFRDILPRFPARCPGRVDRRLTEITVAHLLGHASGWDTGEQADPMFNAARLARGGTPGGLAPAEAAIQHMVCRPLAFDPGARFAYENLNYAVLGRVIEAVTGMPYEAFVRQRVFAPLGITAPRVGGSLKSERLPGEAVYITRGADHRRVPAATGGGRVPLQYGGFHLAAMDSHGGWVASAMDLARFLAGLDGRPGVPDMLPPAAVARMGAARPAGIGDSGPRYALGWYRTRDGAWFHDGSLPGAAALLGMTPGGVLYAALANTRHPNPAFASDFLETVRRAVRGRDRWPGRDLFPVHGYPAH